MYKVGVILYLKTIHGSNRREQLHFLPLRGEHLVSLEAPTHPSIHPPNHPQHPFSQHCCCAGSTEDEAESVQAKVSVTVGNMSTLCKLMGQRIIRKSDAKNKRGVCINKPLQQMNCLQKSVMLNKKCLRSPTFGCLWKYLHDACIICSLPRCHINVHELISACVHVKAVTYDAHCVICTVTNSYDRPIIMALNALRFQFSSQRLRPRLQSASWSWRSSRDERSETTSEKRRTVVG